MNFSIRMLLAAVLSGMIVPAFAARPLDRAVLHGETDKARATDYAVGEEIVFTLTLQGAGEFKAGDYFINWERTGDDGVVDRGRVPLSATEPLIIKTRLGCPGFVRCHAEVVDAKGVRYRKEYQGETVTPEGRKALNRFERSDRRVFFDGGAGAEIEKLASVPEPADFDEFWVKRKARLAEVPMTATVREQKSSDPAVKVYTFSVLCAGPRPVTGTYSVPVDSSR
jgi:hypothetical protein